MDLIEEANCISNEKDRIDLIFFDNVNTLTPKLSKSCYSRAVPGRPARGPYQVRGNLHTIARIQVEMIT